MMRCRGVFALRRDVCGLVQPQGGAVAAIGEFDGDVGEAWCGTMFDGHELRQL